VTLAQDLDVSSSNYIDDWSLVRLLGILEPRLLRDKCPQLVQIDSGAEVLLLSQMEVAHTNFSKIARMIFVKVNSVMMLTTGITTTSGVLTVFPYATVAMAYVASQLPAFL